MSFTAPLTRFENTDLWYAYLPVPDEIADQFIEGNDRRVVCTLQGQVSFQCAFMPLGNGGGWFININKKHRDKLGLVLGQLVTVELEKDRSEYGMPMPEEFREVLNQDEEADRLFHALTPGKQRSLLYWAGNVKSSEIKIRRALVLADHLRANPDSPDFRSLNVELKAANQAAKLR